MPLLTAHRRDSIAVLLVATWGWCGLWGCDANEETPLGSRTILSVHDQQQYTLYRQLAQFHQARWELEQANWCWTALGRYGENPVERGTGGGVIEGGVLGKEKPDKVRRLLRLYDYCMYSLLEPSLAFALAQYGQQIDPHHEGLRARWASCLAGLNKFADPRTSQARSGRLLAGAIRVGAIDPLLSGLLCLASLEYDPLNARTWKILGSLRTMRPSEAEGIYKVLAEHHEERGDLEGAQHCLEMGRALRKEAEEYPLAQRARSKAHGWDEGKEELLKQILALHDYCAWTLRDYRLGFAVAWTASTTFPDRQEVLDRFLNYLPGMPGAVSGDDKTVSKLLHAAKDIGKWDPLLSGLFFLEALRRRPGDRLIREALISLRDRF